MYFEMRTYTIRPGMLASYMKLFEDVGLPVLKKYAELVGYWYTDIGELNQVVHIWRYESLDQRTINRKKLYADNDWQNYFLPEALQMLEKQENKIMHAASFSPIK
ncbi:NIPSNAP family protein [Maridesulfovibrio zosterae]|uniref:NIPSNAP family protein n=1 Tax=Maridesulfovibrio zosterae TaxID=82171 RepID=UPI00040C12CA|nr:NIPSNAP family protein [Maridesulfovibrio zosterae]